MAGGRSAAVMRSGTRSGTRNRTRTHTAGSDRGVRDDWDVSDEDREDEEPRPASSGSGVRTPSSGGDRAQSAGSQAHSPKAALATAVEGQEQPHPSEAAGEAAGLDPSISGRLERARSWLDAEQDTQESCRSLPFTALFYISFFMVQIAHRDVGTVYPLTSALASTMKTGVVPATQGEDVTTRPGSGVGVALAEVLSWGDSLVFLERTVVPYLWAQEDGGPGVVMGVNQLIGGIRVQQWRAATVECVGAQALQDSYSAFMSSRYNRSCRSSESDYQTHGIAGATRIGAQSDEVVQGQYANADTDAYTYWILNQYAGELSSLDYALSHVEGLREKQWLTAATEAVNVEFAMYCGQIGYFALVRLEFVMDRVGAFTATVKANTLQTEVWGSITTVLCDLWFVLNISWLVGGEIFGLIGAIRRNKVQEHVMQFYRVVNLALIFGGGVLIPFFMWMFVQIGEVGNELTSLLNTDSGQTAEDAQVYFSRLDAAYDNVTWMTTAIRWNEMSAFWYSMIMLVKFFQNFNANERLAVITRTLSMSSEDLFHFMLIFLLVFFNFIIGALFLFGQTLKEWSTPILATCTGFRALMGDFDFLAMYYIAPFNATMWFVIYMGFIFLVLVNMFVAIVMEAYAEVKHEAGKSESVFRLVRRNVDRLTQQFTGKKMSRVHSSESGASGAQDEEVFLEDLQAKIDSAQGGLDRLFDEMSAWHGTPRPPATAPPAEAPPERLRLSARLDAHPELPAGATEHAGQAAPAAAWPLVLAGGDADVEWAPTCSCGFAFESASSMRFCGQCGSRRACVPMAAACAGCGSPHRPGDVFCSACGASRGMHNKGPAGEGSRVQYYPLPVATSESPQIRSTLLGPASPDTSRSLDLLKEKKLAELQALMDRYGITFSPTEAQKVLTSQREP